MPAARYWRAVSVSAYGGGDLELSALHAYGPYGRLTGSISSTLAPAAGAITALADDDFTTTVRFARGATQAAGFAVHWDFGSAVEMHGVRAAGPARERALKSLALQYSTDGTTWPLTAANLGDFRYAGPAALTPAPAIAPFFYATPGLWRQGGAPDRSWQRLAASADGSRVAATAVGSYIYTSEDGGITWTPRVSAGTREWYAIAASDDGLRLVASVLNGYLYTSADGGATWTERVEPGSRSWTGVASSADGMHLVATAGSGHIFGSVDAGETWIQQLPANGVLNWQDVASSADGTRLLAVASSGLHYATVDGGGTWVHKPNAPNRGMSTVASSADGLRLVMAGYGTAVYVSADGGDTWESREMLPALTWRGAAMSADGQRAVVVSSEGIIGVSNNGGVSFAALRGAAVRGWYAAAMPGDGRALFAAANGSGIDAYAFRDAIFDAPILDASPVSALIVFADDAIPPHSASILPNPGVFYDVEFGGFGRVTGTVKEKSTPVNIPLRRRVRLVREIDGAVARETWSDSATGDYSFTGISTRYTYSVISYDHLANYRAVIADRLTPEVT